MHIRSFYASSDGELESDLSPERLREAQEDTDGLLWVDIYDPDSEAGDFLSQEMGFHTLAIEDALGEQHQPAKVDEYGSHLFLIVHGIDYSSEEDFVETARLSVFIADSTVVTLHRVELISIDAVMTRVRRDPRLMDRSAGLFTYMVLDALQDAVLPALDHLGTVAAGLEEAAIDAPGREVLQQILQLKRSTIRIQRTIAPQARAFSRLSRDEFHLVGERDSMYFRDLQDQMIQLDVINQGIRDTADNALATYLSSIGIKQNETMRVLAIVAAVFLPLSLLAGIYGMNFSNIPELDWRWGYFGVLGIMGSVGAITFYWLVIRRLNWSLHRSRRALMSVKPPMEQVTRMMTPVSTVTGATSAVARNITDAVSDAVNERKTR